MGNDMVTAEQLFIRLKESGAKVKNSHAVRRMLSRMLVDGLVNKTVPSGHKSVTWGVVED